MPESNFSQTNDHATLRQLVKDAESQVENLTRALETLRATVRRLALQVEMSESAAPATASGFGFGREPQAQAASEDEKPFDFSAVAAALSQEIESASQTETRETGQPESEAPQTALSHKDPGANVPAAPSTAEPEWYGVSDGGSWPVGPKSAAVPLKGEWAIEQPAPSAETWPDVEAADEAFEPEAVVEDNLTEVEEAVAAQEEPVAAAMDPVTGFGAPAGNGVPADGETTDAAAQVAAEEARAEERRLSLSSGWPDEEIWSQSFDWPAMRGSADAPQGDSQAPEPKDDFRSMVDQVRAEIEAARANGEPIDLDEPADAPADDDDARRAEVQRIVEELRNGVTSASEDVAGSEEDDGAFEPAGAADMPDGDDDEAKREEARLAVEAMRAEMAGGHTRVSFDAPPPKTAAPSLDWSHMSADISGPPVIVVKDTEGRVELANVYDLLNRLDCGESAALLNYTPHSVTVGLPIRAAMPSLDAVERAVGVVFGKVAATVDTDGARITVQMGTDGKKKRSEDAA